MHKLNKRIEKLENNQNGAKEESCCECPTVVISPGHEWKGICGNCRNKLTDFRTNGESIVVFKKKAEIENENR